MKMMRCFTSRAPIPYAKEFNRKIGAKEFMEYLYSSGFLKKFYRTPESNLEIIDPRLK